MYFKFNFNFKCLGYSFLISTRKAHRCACADLERCETSLAAEKQQYVTYLTSYKAALAETRIDHLESAWTRVDETWMDIRHWIQM